MNSIEQSLIEQLSTFDIIDCHEHLVPEAERVAMDVDVFTLFRGYNHYGLNLAGMSAEDAFTNLYDTRIPLDERWALAKPYWEMIRHTSYARAALLALQRFYGFDDITDETYAPISAAIQQANTPGIYGRILVDACRIRAALTIPMRTVGMPAPEAPLRYVLTMPFYFEGIGNREALLQPSFAPEARITTLDDYLQALEGYIREAKADGVVGIKIAAQPPCEPDAAAAVRIFDRLRDNGEVPPDANPLRTAILDFAVRCATELDLVLAVHTGYWGDFRRLDSAHLIPLILRHPQARFDIFHLGYPWVRETLMLAKGFPNVWLNLCWTHVISQRMATDALDEAIDLLPMNKLLGFGGDYWKPVEKVYGHLVMAREDIARVLANRIVAGRMTEAQALRQARMWLWDNPKALYKL